MNFCSIEVCICCLYFISISAFAFDSCCNGNLKTLSFYLDYDRGGKGKGQGGCGPKLTRVAKDSAKRVVFLWGISFHLPLIFTFPIFMHYNF